MVGYAVVTPIVFGVVCVGAIGVIESRMYTETQRHQAPVLVAVKLWLSVLLTVLGSVGLAGLVAGFVSPSSAVGTTLGLMCGLAVGIDRVLLSRLDTEHGPLQERWHRWWRHPSDRQ